MKKNSNFKLSHETKKKLKELAAKESRPSMTNMIEALINREHELVFGNR